MLRLNLVSLLVISSFFSAAHAEFLGCYAPASIAYVDGSYGVKARWGNIDRFIVPLNEVVERTLEKATAAAPGQVDQICLQGSKDRWRLYVWQANAANVKTGPLPAE